MLERILKHLRRWAREANSQNRYCREWYELQCAIIELEGLLPRNESEPFDASGYTGE